MGLGIVGLAEMIYLVLSAQVGNSPAIGTAALQASASPKVAAIVTRGNTEAIGYMLYTKYLFPFEVASLILLVAMIGAILLAKKGVLGMKEP